jgi:hypothetical protein
MRMVQSADHRGDIETPLAAEQFGGHSEGSEIRCNLLSDPIAFSHGRGTSAQALVSTQDRSGERDTLMAETSAQMVTAYRNIEALCLLSPSLAATPSFTLATRSLLLAITALDECCDVAWRAEVSP